MLNRRRRFALPAMILAAPFGTVALAATTTILTPQCNTPTPVADLSAPPAGQLTGGQIVRYLVSQGGLSANGAAGVVGNLEQETGLNPTLSDGRGGGGLAQWNASWYQQLAAYATAHGQSPQSDAGQLEYLVYDLHTSYPGLVAELNSAPDAATAATMFETTYELCSGVTGYMQVIPGSLCMDGNRRAYAVAALQQAGGSVSGASAGTPVSLTTGSSCLSPARSSGYANPFAHTKGLVPQRIDMGVDYDGTGEIDALGNARITFAGTGIGGGWVCDTSENGGVVYQLQDGAYQGRYIYTTEDVIPSVHTGQTVAAGQQIADFTPRGCIETGFSSGPAPNPEAAALGQQATAGDAGANRTYCGQQMSNLLVSTGAPAGLTEGKPVTGSSC